MLIFVGCVDGAGILFVSYYRVICARVLVILFVFVCYCVHLRNCFKGALWVEKVMVQR